jgi:hypothetical protein
VIIVVGKISFFRSLAIGNAGPGCAHDSRTNGRPHHDSLVLLTGPFGVVLRRLRSVFAVQTRENTS